MKIELIHPPHQNSVEDRLDPPLGLLSIAAYIRSQLGSQIIINDLSGMSKESWKIGEADIYGITVYATSIKAMNDIIKICKEKNPESIIVIGGAHPSAVPDSSVFSENKDIDYVVIGWGEESLCRIIGGYRSYRYKTLNYSPYEFFLFPSFDLIDVNSYHRTIAGEKSLPLLTTRGCPYQCAFCGLSKMHSLGGKIKSASPETVFSQVCRITDEYGINAINFQDDQFTFNRDRLFEILDLIEPLGIKFRCHGRAGYDTEEVYRRLAEAGCVQVSWGIESGSDYLLDKMNKRSTAKENFEVIQWAKKFDIVSRAFFIIGFPGETKETLDETKKFIMQADPDQYFVSNFVPYPGTDVWNFPEKYGIVKMSDDFDQYYQVGADGTGGLTIDTQWLSRQEFRDLELEFRQWLIDNKEIRGSVLDYEKRIYKNIKK